MAVNVLDNLCVGCGTATKAGDRRSVFGQSTDAIQNLYESILPRCRDTDEVRNKTITESQRFMCRDCRQTHEDIFFSNVFIDYFFLLLLKWRKPNSIGSFSHNRHNN